MKPFDPQLARQLPVLRRPLIWLSALGVLSGIATIVQAVSLAALIVALVQREPLGTATWWVLGAFLIRGMAAALTEHAAAHCATTASTAIRTALLHSYIHEPHTSREVNAAPWHDTPGEEGSGTGVLTWALHGASSVEPYFARYLPTLVSAVVIPVGVLITMAVLDPITALIPFLTLPLMPLFAALIGMSTRDATQQRWQELSRLSGHFLDVMRGLPTLVNYGRAHRQTSTIAEVSIKHRDATLRTLALAFVSSAALELLATISVALVAVYVGIRLAGGDMSLWPALPLILLAPEAYWPIRRVGAEYHTAADGAAALDMILPHVAAASRDTWQTTDSKTQATAATETAGDPPGDDPAHVAQLTNVTFAYAPDLPPVLHEFSATITSGLTLVTGPSGGGKTTLLRLLAGIYHPTDGTVSTPHAHLVTQHPFLMSGTVRSNLLLSHPDASDQELEAALSRVGLADSPDLCAGLDTPLGEAGHGLSAGQRARLALARAFLVEAPLILCDEPTANLDPHTQRTVSDALHELSATRAVVVVTHDPAALPNTDVHITVPHVRHTVAAGGPAL